jgi:hypothetical protein
MNAAIRIADPSGQAVHVPDLCAATAAIGGAIVGGAIASQNGYYYGPGYYGPAYVADPGYYGPPCYWQRQRFWDGYGWRVRNVRICN